jgi:hypothetical protein
MVSIALALDLQRAGLRWDPVPGDRFVLPNRQMDNDVFVLSDMTVEVHEFPAGPVIGFNGTTEWALDSVAQGDALWLPAEDQLRRRLGGLFVRLEAHRDDVGVLTFAVTIRTGKDERTFTDTEPAQAYGQALLSVLAALSEPVGT